MKCGLPAVNLYSCTRHQHYHQQTLYLNFAVWWDADLQRELLDNITISKWNYSSSNTSTLLTASGCASNNGTKATPCLSGDILGDWREEVILRTSDNSALRIFTYHHRMLPIAFLYPDARSRNTELPSPGKTRRTINHRIPAFIWVESERTACAQYLFSG